MLQGADNAEMVSHFLEVSEGLNRLQDIDTILDRTLYEVRKLANADAGSIFLLKDGVLRFSYVHNDTLFGQGDIHGAVYANFSVPVTEKSIVGHSALSGETTVIDDAYNLPDDVPYHFNDSYDRACGYHTTSIMTVPLIISQGRLVGVMQILNARDGNGTFVPFPKRLYSIIPLFAKTMATAIERGLMTRELMLRMVKMAELRDPSETAAHVQRVGAYSAEIYHRYAINRGIPTEELTRYKDHLRLAAMLHDVGKVGISDSILKKPGKLTEEEFAEIMQHTLLGGRLFENTHSDLDVMCRDVALYHHEKWAGGGYPGKIDDLFATDTIPGIALKGEEIPLSARICALADVYDALVSKRSYKPAFAEEKALAIIKEGSGTHFDPEIVKAFFQIHDVILAIREKFQE